MNSEITKVAKWATSQGWTIDQAAGLPWPPPSKKEQRSQRSKEQEQ
jgi:hypothetical protein